MALLDAGSRKIKDAMEKKCTRMEAQVVGRDFFFIVT
jgi:hypothetical protein